MNVREKFLKVMHHKTVSEFPDLEFGYWDETIQNWIQEGHLPADLLEDAQDGIGERFRDNSKHKLVERHLGFEQLYDVPVSVNLHPPFQVKVLKEDHKHRIIRNERGVICRELKKRESMPEFLEFPVKDEDDFHRLIDRRMDSSDADRYPEDWDELARKLDDRDYPLGVFCGSLYGWVRYWMGFERASRTFIQNPDFIHEMMEFIADHVTEVVGIALGKLQEYGIELDYAHFWEDMCYNKGPLISPAMFEEFMLPRYKRITGLLKNHGIDIIFVDSDGKIDELVPLWLEGGVNCMFPVEAAHTSPKRLREKFGDRVLMMGGIDKRALIEGNKEAIDRELNKLPPLLESGGYIPHIDHRVPPDVSFESYSYYMERKREMLGLS